MSALPENASARLGPPGERAQRLTGNGSYASPNRSQVTKRGETFADADAERIILASTLDGGGSNGEFPDADLFFYPQNKLIHQAIATLKLRGVPVDIVTVTQVLDEAGELERAGGAYAITQLGTDYYGKSPEIVKYELGRLHEFRAKREQRSIAERMLKGDTTPEDAQQQLAALAREHPTLPVIKDAAVFQGKSIILPNDIVAGVLHAGGKSVVSGCSKSYKTWLLTDLGISVATGTAWLNEFLTKQGRALYINLEIQEPFFANRIRTICDGRHLKLEPGTLDVWNLRGYAMDLPRLLRRIAHGKYGLIVVDPIYKLLHGRDENKAGDIASLMNEMEVLAVQTGAAVVFGAHYSKGNQAQKESIDRIGGSGVFARDPDTIINFTRHEEDDCFAVEMTLRNHAPQKPFVVRWEFPLFVVDDMLDPANLQQAGRKPDGSLAAGKVLELLDKPMSTTEWMKLTSDELGASKATFYRRKDELEKAGKIQMGKGRKWSQVSK
jgi:hypothetical protein